MHQDSCTPGCAWICTHSHWGSGWHNFPIQRCSKANFDAAQPWRRRVLRGLSGVALDALKQVQQCLEHLEDHNKNVFGEYHLFGSLFSALIYQSPTAECWYLFTPGSQGLEFFPHTSLHRLSVLSWHTHQKTSSSNAMAKDSLRLIIVEAIPILEQNIQKSRWDWYWTTSLFHT